MRNKRALSQMVVLIIAVVGMLLVLSVVQLVGKEIKVSGPEVACRTSVVAAQNIYVNMPGESLDLKMPPFACTTQDKVVAEKGKEKQEAMEEMAKLVARCWWQYGEGTIEKNVFGAYRLSWPWKSQDRCSICYKFTIEDIKDADTITKNEFQHYLRTGVYDLLEKPVENCKNNIDDDHDGFIDNDDDDCYLQKDKCEYKGGTCTEQVCNPGKVKVDEWGCSDKKICCLDENRVVTYQYFVEDLNGPGVIVIVNDEFREKADEYVVAFSSDTTNLWQEILKKHPGVQIAYLIKDLLTDKPPQTQVIYVGELNQLRDYCNIWRD